MGAHIQTAVRGGLLCLASLLVPLAAHADPALVQRLRTEAAQAWRDRLNDRGAIQGVCHQSLKDEKGVLRPGTLEVIYNTECARSKMTQSTGVTEVYCYNPKYRFHLRSEPNQGWAIATFHAGDPAASTDARTIRDRIEGQAWVFEAGFRDLLYQEPLYRYVEASVARIEANPGSVDRPGLVEIKIEMESFIKDSYVRKLSGLLDPAHGWRPVRLAQSVEPPGATADLTAEYEYAPDGLIQRANIRSAWKTLKGKTWTTETDRRFELKRVTNLPDTSEFTLSAFGLPEPVGVEWPKRRSGWLWLAWAGAAFVVVGLAFVALKRRAARRQAAAPPTPS